MKKNLIVIFSVLIGIASFSLAAKADTFKHDPYHDIRASFAQNYSFKNNFKPNNFPFQHQPNDEFGHGENSCKPSTPTSTVATYTITTSVVGGTISPSGTIIVPAGSNETFTATADPGYQNNGIIVDGDNLGGDGGTTQSYTFTDVTANHTIEADFIRGTDATLGDLTVSNGYLLSPAFGGNTYTYTVTLPAGTTSIPTISFRTNDPTATGVATQATTLPGSATVVVTAQDGIEQLTYTVNFVEG